MAKAFQDDGRLAVVVGSGMGLWGQKLGVPAACEEKMINREGKICDLDHTDFAEGVMARPLHSRQ